ncbi:MAG: hypothetical protein ABSB14_14610 [Candidatus Sulfotelmatobacter sp.]|jgi:hypothetical protein
MRIFESSTLHMTLAVILTTGLSLWAQQVGQSPPPPAPLPSQLLAGKKVFISNVPGALFLSPRNAEDDPYRPYNQFYASLKSWGYYELVPAPADADLIFEINLADRPTLGNAMVQSSVRLAYLDLTVRDPKTQAVLWWFAERVQGANRPATGEKNYNEAMTNLVNDVKKAIGQYSAGPANAKK